ncbi:MAG: AAA family ATPase, partial [Myxococcota bacterium]
TSVGATGKRVERTEVVILCGDLRGFGALRANTNHERWQQVLLDYIRIVESLAFKNDAVVDRVGEHGFTLLLGLPVSSENDAERAMQLALDLMEAVEGMNLNLILPLQLSIGGMVGAVVVEHELGEERKFDWSWDDDAGAGGGLYLAEALARAAMAREVLIGGRVWRRVRRSYRADALSSSVPIEIDGEDVELSAYKLQGPMSVREHLRAVKRAYHRVVGREIELKSLRRLYRDVRMTGSTRAVLLVGEHGVGKSTLVHEFMAGLRAAPGQRAQVHLFQGVVDLRDKERVYGALVGLLREVLQVGRETDMRRVLARLQVTIERLLSDLPESERTYVVHSLAFLLGIKLDRNLIERLDPEHRRARIGSSLRRMMQGLAADRPVVFTIEDIHNGDPSSLEFLAEHLGRGHKAPVLFVLTSLVLDGDRSSSSSWVKLLATPNLTVEPLHELEPLSARELAQGLLDETLAQDTVVVERLVERAGHNPLYLKETAELLKERGIRDPEQAKALLSDTDGWLPTTVEGLVTSRLDRLPAGSKQTLRRCALLGRAFTLELLGAMLSLAPDDAAIETVRHQKALLHQEVEVVT